MSDHRDPEVTKTRSKKSNGVGKWIGIAAAVLVALLLLGWLLGWFAGEQVGNESFPAVTEEPDAGDEAEVIVDPDVSEDPGVPDEPLAAEESEIVE